MGERLPEPMGLGAVAEDVEGHLYVRIATPCGGDPAHWSAQQDQEGVVRRWREVPAVHIRSHGYDGKPMTDPTVDAERRAAEVLAQHQFQWRTSGTWCHCGWGDVHMHPTDHQAHVAAMLAQAGVLADAQHDAEERKEQAVLDYLDTLRGMDPDKVLTRRIDAIEAEVLRARAERTEQA